MMRSEIDRLEEELNPPGDWLSPDWDSCSKCHDWKNYVSKALMGEWEHLAAKQRLMIAAMLDEVANREEWE